MRLGANLGPCNYWQGDAKCTDLLHPLVAFWPPKQPGVTYDNDGYPLSLGPGQCQAWILAATEYYTPPGRYRMTCQGSGDLLFSHPDLDPKKPGGQVTPAPGGWWRPRAKAPGATTVIAEWDVRESKRLQVGLYQTDPKDHLRSLRFHRVGLDPTTQMFHPDYVASLRGFDTLRSMQFMNTVGNREVSWPSFAGDPHGRAAQWAAFFSLCNAANANAWVNLPHACDTNYATRLGALADNLLKPGLLIYVEKGNECWNWGPGFNVGTAWMQDYAKQHGMTDAKGEGIKEFAYATLAARDIELVRMAAPKHKVVGVYANQFAWFYLTQIAVPFMEQHNLLKSFDVLAIAPYVDAPGFDYHLFDHACVTCDGPTEDQATAIVMDAFVKAGLPQLEKWIQPWAALSKQLNKPLVCYECGPSWTIPSNPALRVPLYKKISRRPEMEAFLTDVYFPWLAKYCELGNYYCHTSWWGDASEWGMNVTLGEDTAKYRAARAWALAHSAVP